MKSETERQRKVARQVQRDLSEIIPELTRDIQLTKMLTVTIVRVSPDLGMAKVYISVFPSEDAQVSINLLNEHKNTLRHNLGVRMRHQVKKIPDLHFYLDDTLDYLENIDRLLKS